MSVSGISRERLLSVLGEAEWFLPHLNDNPRCPVCEERQPSSYEIGKPPEVVTEGGHAPGCRLARLIADVERGTDSESVDASRLTVDRLAAVLDQVGTCWTHEGVGSAAPEMAAALFAALGQPTMRRYEDEITIPDSTTLRQLDEILDKLREYGSAEYQPRNRTAKVVFEQVDDWDLREMLAEIEVEISTYGVNFDIDKAKVE